MAVTPTQTIITTTIIIHIGIIVIAHKKKLSLNDK